MDYSQLPVIIVLFLYHLAHFLQLLLVSLGHVGPNAYLTSTVPKRLSSISHFLATYLAFSDLLFIESDVFWLEACLRSFL